MRTHAYIHTHTHTHTHTQEPLASRLRGCALVVGMHPDQATDTDGWDGWDALSQWLGYQKKTYSLSAASVAANAKSALQVFVGLFYSSIRSLLTFVRTTSGCECQVGSENSFSDWWGGCAGAAAG